MYVFPCSYYDYHQTALTRCRRMWSSPNVPPTTRLSTLVSVERSERGHVVSGGIQVPYAPSYMTKSFGKDVKTRSTSGNFLTVALSSSYKVWLGHRFIGHTG